MRARGIYRDLGGEDRRHRCLESIMNLRSGDSMVRLLFWGGVALTLAWTVFSALATISIG
jgi:hypothetical protein